MAEEKKKTSKRGRKKGSSYSKKKYNPAPSPIKKRKRQPRNDMVDRERVVSFKAWFVNCIDSESRLKEHHYAQIKAYMKGLGLKDREPGWKFELGLRQYFGE